MTARKIGLPLVSLLTFGLAPALADYTVVGGASDFEPRIALAGTGGYSPGNSTINTTIRVGVSGGSTNRVYGNVAVFFKLPALQPNEAITGANLRLTEILDAADVTPPTNADLWAIGYDNNPSPPNDAPESQAYFFNGILDPNPGVGAGAVRTLIQDNFLIPTDVLGSGQSPTPHDTNAAGDASLLAYIQSLYANPNVIPGTTSVILRLNYDDPNYAPTAATNANRYLVGAAENTTPQYRPMLTLTTVVPEPATAALFASGAMLLISRRRRASVGR